MPVDPDAAVDPATDPATEPVVEPDATEPAAAADPDLEAIAADLAAIEATLDQLAAGTYRHEADPAPGAEGAAAPPAP